MNKKVLIILADGFEEIEAVTPIDVLRRAGVEVTVAGVGTKDVTGAHGLTLHGDTLLDQYHGVPDAVILPGGMPGAKNLAGYTDVSDIIQRVHGAGKVVAAICAAPALVLAPLGLLDGRRATCYPGFEKNLSSKTKFVTDRVVRDGNVITSRGPGTALEFALELVSQLVGPGEVKKLTEAMIVK